MIKRFENKYIQSIRRGYLSHIIPNKKCYGFEYHHNSNGCEIFNEKYFPEIKCCIQAVRSLKRNYCSNNQCYKSTNYCILFLPAFNKSCLKYYFWRVSYRVFLEASYDRM